MWSSVNNETLLTFHTEDHVKLGEPASSWFGVVSAKEYVVKLVGTGSCQFLLSRISEVGVWARHLQEPGPSQRLAKSHAVRALRPWAPAAMAVTVLNDLKAPIEVKDPESKTWEVVYPRQSWSLSGDEVTQVRLREEPAVQSSCERQGTLRASEDFGEVSTRGKDLDAFHERSVARERTRRSNATKRQRRQRVAREEVNTALMVSCCIVGSTLGVCPPLLVFFASNTPEDAGAALGLAVMAALLCCCISVRIPSIGSYTTFEVCALNSLRLGGLLCLAALVWMTIRHVQEGFWFTSLILWPAACCGCLMFTGGFCLDKNEGRLEAHVRRLERAEAEIQTRSLRFEGSVIREVGRPCITSWPGKYEGAWERLVAESRQGQVSAAVVFLPDGSLVIVG